MINLGDVKVLWAREMTQFIRRPLQLASLLMGPLIWLFVFGFGIRRGLNVTIQGYDYVHYILPGILGMILLRSSSRGGMSILRDKDAGFLREVLVAPVSRFSILLGVAGGRVTRSLVQATLLLAVGIALGIRFAPGLAGVGQILGALLLITVLGISLVSLTIALAWKMGDIQSYAALTGWAIFPLILLSGGLYPVKNLPVWLGTPIRLNPMTYGVDSLRHVILGPGAASFPFLLDLMVIVGFFLVCTSLGSIVMRKVVSE